jgi:YidC/Oxa1 family membrane protein insertase
MGFDAPAPPSQALHHFRPTLHHPIVHAAQHLISPLTGSLLIWAMLKSYQWPSALATLRGAALLRAAGELSPLAALKARAPALGMTVAATVSGCFLWRAAASMGALPHQPDHVLADELGKLYPRDEAPLVRSALSHWPTSEVVVAGLRALREATGLPWWATITAATLGMRVALAPINILLLRNSLRIKMELPELTRLGAVIGDAAAPQAARLVASRDLHALLRARGASPWAQTFVFPLLLPPVILSVFGAVHNLCLSEENMAHEGALWFPDLVAKDRTQLLPIMSNLSWLWQVEMGAGAHYAASPNVRLVARVLAVATVPLAATLPSGVFIFWCTSNFFAIARGYVVRLPAVRARLGIPQQREIMALPHLPPWRGS